MLIPNLTKICQLLSTILMQLYQNIDKRAWSARKLGSE